MKLKTQLRVIAAFFVVALVIIAASIVFTNQQLDNLAQEEALARTIEVKANELAYLSSEYVQYRDPRLIELWEAKHASMTEDLSNLAAKKTTQQASLDILASDHQRIKTVFDDVVTSIGTTPADTTLAQVSWSRLAVQSQGIISDASRLTDLLAQEQEEARRTNNLLIIALMGTFSTLLLAGYVMVYRRTLRSIGDLSEGAKIIGSGNLDHTISVSSDDEIGELTRRFNQMTANLKTVTASKEDLEREMANRKRTEASLRESEDRFHAFMDNSPAVAWIKDEQGRYVYLNKTCQDRFNLRFEDYGGKTDLELWPPEIARQFQENDRAVLNGEHAIEIIEETLNPQGKTVYNQNFKFPLQDASGKRYVGGIGIDITDRKRAEEALQESESRYRTLVENALDIVLVHDSEKILYINPTGLKILGASHPEEILGRAPLSIVHPDFHDRVQTNMVKDLQGDPSPQTQLQLLRLNGTSFWAEGQGVHTDYGGKPAVQVILRDITDRRRAEQDRMDLIEQVRQERDKIHTIVSSIADEVWFIDADLHTILLNPAVVSNLGLKGGEQQSLDQILASLEILNPDGTPRSPEEAPLYRSLQGEVLSGDEMVRHLTTGELRHRRYHSSPVRDAAGRIIGAVCIVSDITEQKRSAEQLQEYAQNLKRSNEDLERFAYVSSHDLQEPLRNIVVYTQLLARRYQSQLDSDADEFIQYIVNGGKRMQTLINDLLDYSRVTSKGRTYALTNMESVLHQVESSLHQFARENTAFIAHDPLPTVMADETQLVLVFQNLIGNAIKFRREGEPVQIHIGATHLDHDWQFSVKDNGIGIEPQYFEKIFVIFQRLHNQNQYGGTGIGLAVVKRIIDRHGGRIWVESEVGKGSTFYFTIPDMPVNSSEIVGGGGEISPEW
jgi:PAS domain S-box-containing protein